MHRRYAILLMLNVSHRFLLLSYLFRMLAAFYLRHSGSVRWKLFLSCSAVKPFCWSLILVIVDTSNFLIIFVKSLVKLQQLCRSKYDPFHFLGVIFWLAYIWTNLFITTVNFSHYPSGPGFLLINGQTISNTTRNWSDPQLPDCLIITFLIILLHLLLFSRSSTGISSFNFNICFDWNSNQYFTSITDL